MFVCCECCVLSGRGLCDELITRPEESYRLWCVVVCDLETSRMWRPWPALGRSATGEKKTYVSLIYELKKIERYLLVNLLGPGPRLMKKELPGRGLTKVETQCCGDYQNTMLWRLSKHNAVEIIKTQFLFSISFFFKSCPL